MSARIVNALERIAAALEQHSPTAADFDSGICWRWHNGDKLQPLPPPSLKLSDLCGVDNQISRLRRNTFAFLQGKPSHHVLLSGPRGTGKSSVVRGVFAQYAADGLRLIETDAAGLAELSRLVAAIGARAEKFIVYCDDLSFGQHVDRRLFQQLKSALDGSIAEADNIRVYVTSNRRHLTAEYFEENMSRFIKSGGGGEEIHGGEGIEENIALSDRFGLWVPFFDLSLAEYENVVRHWLRVFGMTTTTRRLQNARRFADERGSRNGRIARHFAVACANRTV